MSRRKKGDSREYTKWLEYAESDIVAAEFLSKNEVTLKLSAFCCHQAIEKTLKAYFLFCDGYAPDGHNIIFLCKRAMKDNEKFMMWLDECVTLNGAYIQTRYPPDFEFEISKKTAYKYANMAKKLHKFVFDELLDDLDIK